MLGHDGYEPGTDPEWTIQPSLDFPQRSRRSFELRSRGPSYWPSLSNSIPDANVTVSVLDL